MYTQCPRCGAMIRDPGRDFPCPRCGVPVRSAGQGFVADEESMGPLASIHMSGEPGWKALLRALQQLSRLGSFVLFALSLVLCFAALFVGIPKVIVGTPASDLQAVLYILTPAPLGLFAFGGTAMAAYHLFLAGAITSSLIYLLLMERKKLRPLMSESAARFRSPDRHIGLGVVQLPQVFFAIFFFDIIFAIIMALSGTTTRTPAFETYPDWYLYFTFANASVYEEFAARTLLLGIPLMLAYIMAFSRRARPGFGRYAAPPVPVQFAGAAATQPAVVPAAAPFPPPKPDALIDVSADELSTRVVPRIDDRKTPIASAPVFRAPDAVPPPLAPTVEAQLLALPKAATSSQPAPVQPQPPQPQPAAPYPPPGPAVPLFYKAAAPQTSIPAIPSQPRTLREYLRSRTTNGMWGYFLGGGFTIGPLEAFFIVGSSLMFGLAHVAGWDMWKALPTFIAGLGFGYLFLKVGIHAAILLHFSFDYLSLGQALLPGFVLMELLLLGLWTVVGAFYFGHYVVLAVKWLMEQARPAKGRGTDEGNKRP